MKMLIIHFKIKSTSSDKVNGSDLLSEASKTKCF